MTRTLLDDTLDLAAGRAAFFAGTSLHYNPHLNAMHETEPPTIEARQRYEAWRCGWIAAAQGR
jgi:hypothetical protein